MKDWLDLKTASELTGLSESGLRRDCNTGAMAQHGEFKQIAKGRRLKWVLHPDTIRSLRNEEPAGDYESIIQQWEEEMLSGYHTGEKLEPSSVKTSVSGMASFWKYLGTWDELTDKWTPRPANIEDVTIENIRRAIAASPKGHNIYRGSKSFYALLVRLGLREESDLFRFKAFKPKANRDPKRTFLKDTEEDFRKLAQENEDWRESRSEEDRVLTGVIIQILYHTGMRVGEMVQLEMKHINWAEACIHIPGKITKTKTQRRVGMRTELIAVLKWYLEKRPQSDLKYLVVQPDGSRLTTHAAWRRVKSLGIKAGIDITPHGFRHTLITSLLLKGVPATKVQKIAGHTKASTTHSYDRSTDEDALDVLRVKQAQPTQNPMPTFMEIEDIKPLPFA